MFRSSYCSLNDSRSRDTILPRNVREKIVKVPWRITEENHSKFKIWDSRRFTIFIVWWNAHILHEKKNNILSGEKKQHFRTIFFLQKEYCLFSQGKYVYVYIICIVKIVNFQKSYFRFTIIFFHFNKCHLRQYKALRNQQGNNVTIYAFLLRKRDKLCINRHNWFSSKESGNVTTVNPYNPSLDYKSTTVHSLKEDNNLGLKLLISRYYSPSLTCVYLVPPLVRIDHSLDALNYGRER